MYHYPVPLYRGPSPIIFTAKDWIFFVTLPATVLLSRITTMELLPTA